VSAIRFQVNGEGRHSGDLDRMIWPLPEIIATPSSLFTLTPGDLIHTDTPEGVDAIKATTGPPGSNPQ
jgi:fumarylpyruvate hydrolase